MSNNTLNLFKGKKSSITDDMEGGEALPQYELKNEEFEIENVEPVSRKDLSKFSQSEFALVNNNELFAEIDIFGHKETVNFAENTDTITVKLCQKYDVPFLSLKNIVESRKREYLASQGPINARNRSDNTRLVNGSYKSDAFHKSEELSGIDIFQERKQLSEKGPNSYVNFEVSPIKKKLSNKVLENELKNNVWINNDGKGKDQQLPPNIFTIDHLYEDNKKNITTKQKKDSTWINTNKKMKNVEKSPKHTNSLSSSRISASTFSVGSSDFLGERLYRKSIALASENKRNSVKLKEKTDLDQNKHCTFNPKISQAKSLFGVDIKPKLYEKKKEIIEISPEKIISPKKVFLSNSEADKLFDKLHREKEVIETQKSLLQNEYFSQFKYAPDITDKSKPVLMHFFKRLQDWILKKTDKERDDLEKANFDEKTGQELFHPVISKKSKEIQKKNVWEDLYQEQKVIESNKKGAYIKTQKEFELQNKMKIDMTKSDLIVEKLKISVFKKLFKSLDANCNNHLSYSDFTNEHLPANILAILEGISTNLKENNLTLTEDAFIEAVQQIEQAMNYEEKTKLFHWYHHEKLHVSIKCTMNQENVEKYPFAPEISKKSDDIYSQSTRQNKNFLLRNSELLKNKEDFILTKKNEKETLELKECTFSPQLNRKDPYIFKANINLENKKQTINSATIVSKNTYDVTNRTLKTINEGNTERKGEMKTINVEDQHVNDTRNQKHLGEGQAQGQSNMISSSKNDDLPPPMMKNVDEAK